MKKEAQTGDPEIPEIPEAAVSHTSRRISVVWIVPLVAALLGLWLVWQYYHSKGPLAIVRFETATGVVAGKTKVQRRSVDVGIVESVRLSDDLNGVVMALRINADAAQLLREDTQFWVVRPRLGGAGVSGLGTIVSGAYVELDPGASKVPKSEFTGLEQPPVTPQGVPGLRLRLVAEETGSLGPGASVVFKGISVGRIEDRVLEFESNQVIFDVFIEEQYARLVTNRTRFWNSTGVDMELSADGFYLRTGSLETMFAGSVEFDTPTEAASSEGVENNRLFVLHDSKRKVEEVELEPRLPYLLMFEDSVRGLSAKAPVEFRGIKVGTVVGVSFDYAPGDPGRRIPVLIRLDPGAFGESPGLSDEEGEKLIAASVANGLRATLKSGSLLTGKLFVDLVLDPEAPPAEVGQIESYATLPTVSSGLALLEDKLTLVLDKLEKLPVEDTLNGATDALAEIKEAARTLKGAVGEVETLLASDGIRNFPERLDSALVELNKTISGFDPDSALYRDLTGATQELQDSLRSIRTLADTLERKPNSIIFGRSSNKVKPPSAKP